MNPNRKRPKGDLSAPVLAIIVTVGIIAAGLVLMAWFWWFAPSASRMSVIIIVGQPALIYGGTAGGSYNYVLYISVKNIGNTQVEVRDIILNGTSAISIYPSSIKLGQESTIIEAEFKFLQPINVSYVDCVLLTDSGAYTFRAIVI
ncbi:MAG: hypothetical protein QXK88_02975 [Desulfurococcaceae archaeon]